MVAAPTSTQGAMDKGPKKRIMQTIVPIELQAWPLAFTSLPSEPGHKKLYRISQSRRQHLKEENGGKEPRRGKVPAVAHKAADEQQSDKNRRNGNDAYRLCDFLGSRSIHKIICEDNATLQAERD